MTAISGLFALIPLLISCVSVESTVKNEDRLLEKYISNPEPTGKKRLLGECHSVGPTIVECIFRKIERCKIVEYKKIQRTRITERTGSAGIYWAPLIISLPGIACGGAGGYYLADSKTEPKPNDSLTPGEKRTTGIALLATSANFIVGALVALIVDGARITDTEEDIGVMKVVESKEEVDCNKGLAANEDVEIYFPSVNERKSFTTNSSGVLTIDLKNFQEEIGSQEDAHEIRVMKGRWAACSLPLDRYNKWLKKEKKEKLVEGVRKTLKEGDGNRCLSWIKNHEEHKMRKYLKAGELNQLLKCATNGVLTKAGLAMEENNFEKVEAFLADADEFGLESEELLGLKVRYKKVLLAMRRKNANQYYLEAAKDLRNKKFANAHYMIEQCLEEIENYPKCKRLTNRIEKAERREERRQAARAYRVAKTKLRQGKYVEAFRSVEKCSQLAENNKKCLSVMRELEKKFSGLIGTKKIKLELVGAKPDFVITRDYWVDGGVKREFTTRKQYNQWRDKYLGGGVYDEFWRSGDCYQVGNKIKGCEVIYFIENKVDKYRIVFTGNMDSLSGFPVMRRQKVIPPAVIRLPYKREGEGYRPGIIEIRWEVGSILWKATVAKGFSDEILDYRLIWASVEKK